VWKPKAGPNGGGERRRLTFSRMVLTAVGVLGGERRARVRAWCVVLACHAGTGGNWAKGAEGEEGEEALLRVVQGLEVLWCGLAEGLPMCSSSPFSGGK
jgi:hypothetical protein